MLRIRFNYIVGVSQEDMRCLCGYVMFDGRELWQHLRTNETPFGCLFSAIDLSYSESK